MNVIGPDIPAAPEYGGCSGANIPYVGIMGGLAWVSGGSIDLDVPVGVNRTVQLFALQSTIGCPQMSNLLGEKFNTTEMSQPMLVGSATTDVLEDTSVTIVAHYDPGSPLPMVCASKEPTRFKVVDSDSGSGVSAQQYVAACKKYQIVLETDSNQVAKAPSDVTISFGSIGSGTFYTASNCATSLSSVTIPAGSSSADVYFRDNIQESVSLSLFSSTLSFDGFTIGVNPAFVPGELPTSVVVNSGFVYWSDSLDWGSPTSSVKKVPTTGGAPTPLATNVPYTSSLAVDGTDVFWIDNGNSRKVPVSGGATQVLAAGYNTNIVADASYLYYAFSPNGVQKVNKSTGTVTVLDPDTVVGAAPFALAVNATDVFWANWSGVLRKVPIAGGATTDLATGAYASALVATSTALYWTDSSGVHTTPVNGGPTVLVASGQPKCLAVDAASIYWADSGSIKKVPLGGGPTITLASGLTTSFVQNGSVTSYCIALDATHVYWATQNGLYKVPK